MGRNLHRMVIWEPLERTGHIWAPLHRNFTTRLLLPAAAAATLVHIGHRTHRTDGSGGRLRRAGMRRQLVLSESANLPVNRTPRRRRNMTNDEKIADYLRDMRQRIGGGWRARWRAALRIIAGSSYHGRRRHRCGVTSGSIRWRERRARDYAAMSGSETTCWTRATMARRTFASRIRVNALTRATPSDVARKSLT
jgi:hypothetical protein